MENTKRNWIIIISFFSLFGAALGISERIDNGSENHPPAVMAGRENPGQSAKTEDPYLLEFTAPWCGYCLDMKPLVEKLEKEEKVHVKQHDTDTAEGDAKYLEWNKKAKRHCRGIPFFVNTRTLNSICGAADYERLKSWALEKPEKHGR